MIILLIILIFLILLCYIRISNNEDLIDANCKTDNDLINIKNAKKVFRKAKIPKILLLISLLSLIIILLCQFTDIDVKIIDYISIDLIHNVYNKKFNFNLYFIPIYIIVIREILIQVKIGEFILKFFNAEEPKLEENPLKYLLYKKVPTNSNNANLTNTEKNNDNPNTNTNINDTNNKNNSK